MMQNCAELLEVFAATVQIGAWLIVPNWHLTADEVAFLLQDASVHVIVADGPCAPVAADAADRVGIEPGSRYCTVPHEGFATLATLQEGQPPTPITDRHPGQVMFYTSGTTGRPKGVRKKVAEVAAEDVGLETALGLLGRAPFDPANDAVHLVGGPLYHAAPLAAAATALDSGALLVLMGRWTPERFLELVERHRVTTATMVPTMFHRLLALPDDVREAADVSSLRMVTHAGAPCGLDLKHRMLEWFGPVISEYYSATEGPGTSVTAEEWLARPGTVGRPMPGVTVRILDDDGGECPVGTPGPRLPVADDVGVRVPRRHGEDRGQPARRALHRGRHRLPRRRRLPLSV